MNWFSIVAAVFAVTLSVISCESKENLEDYTIEDFGASEEGEKEQDEYAQ